METDEEIKIPEDPDVPKASTVNLSKGDGETVSQQSFAAGVNGSAQKRTPFEDGGIIEGEHRVYPFEVWLTKVRKGITKATNAKMNRFHEDDKKKILSIPLELKDPNGLLKSKQKKTIVIMREAIAVAITSAMVHTRDKETDLFVKVLEIDAANHWKKDIRSKITHNVEVVVDGLLQGIHESTPEEKWQEILQCNLDRRAIPQLQAFSDWELDHTGPKLSSSSAASTPDARTTEQPPTAEGGFSKKTKHNV